MREKESKIFSRYDDLSSGELKEILFELMDYLEVQAVAKRYEEDDETYFFIENVD